MPDPELLLDLTVWRELQDTAGAQFTVELARTFLDEAPGMLAELRAALDRADGAAFRRAAPRIRSRATR